MLSPTLPPWVEEALPKRILSPTLPEIFNGIEDEGDISEQSLSDGWNGADAGRPRGVAVRKTAGVTKQASKVSDGSAKTEAKRKSLIVTLRYTPGRRPGSRMSRKESDKRAPIKQNSESRPESRTDSRNASKAESRTDVKAESKTESKTQTQSESKPSRSEPKYEPKREDKDSKKDTRAESKQDGKKTPDARLKREDNADGSARRQTDDRPQAKRSAKDDLPRPARVSRSYSSSSSDSDSPLARQATPARNKTSPRGKQKTPVVSGTSSGISTAKDKDKDDKDLQQRDANSQILKKKMMRWQDLARSKKHEADAARRRQDERTASVLSLDSLCSFIVAFDYEDRAEQMLRRGPQHRLWSTLIPYMTQMIKTFEEHRYTALAGLCYQLRALTQQRIAQSYQHVLQRAAKRAEGDDDGQIAAVVAKMAHAQDSATADFRKGFELLPLGTLEKDFAKTWASRAPKPLAKVTQEGGYRPMTDAYYVPLHTFSTLQQGAALAFHMAKEWADAHKVECEWALARGIAN